MTKECDQLCTVGIRTEYANPPPINGGVLANPAQIGMEIVYWLPRDAFATMRQLNLQRQLGLRVAVHEF